jgi:hypothetical protein
MPGKKRDRNGTTPFTQVHARGSFQPASQNNHGLKGHLSVLLGEYMEMDPNAGFENTQNKPSGIIWLVEQQINS